MGGNTVLLLLLSRSSVHTYTYQLYSRPSAAGPKSPPLAMAVNTVLLLLPSTSSVHHYP